VTLALSSVAAFTACLAGAKSVDFASYTLHPGPVRSALVEAARAGAGVRVRLEGRPLDDAAGTLRAANLDSVAVLAAAGADAALTPAGSPELHLKAAVVDGVAWLDDRNWTGDVHETVVRDSDAGASAELRRALHGDPGGDGPLQTTKGAAAAAEAALLRGAGDHPVDVESESFGTGPVYAVLLARARAGSPSRLLVASREASGTGAVGDAERRCLARLASLGVEIRTGGSRETDLSEKLALVPDAVWIGSANATYAGGWAGQQADWGIATRDPGIVDGIRAAFEANWRDGRPY
jgi:hypothetical protein